MKTIRIHAVPFLLGLAILLCAWTVARAAPSDDLHDPIAQPNETIRDLSDAAKVGWAALASAAVLIACKLAGYLRGRVAWFGAGWRPVAFTFAAAVATGVYDVARLGGTGVALLAALLVATAAAIPNRGPAPGGAS